MRQQQKAPAWPPEDSTRKAEGTFEAFLRNTHLLQAAKRALERNTDATRTERLKKDVADLTLVREALLTEMDAAGSRSDAAARRVKQVREESDKLLRWTGQAPTITVNATIEIPANLKNGDTIALRVVHPSLV